MVKQKRPTVQFIHKFVEKILEEIKDFDGVYVGLYLSTYTVIGGDGDYEMVNSYKGTKINSINDLKVLPKCNLRDVFLCITTKITIAPTGPTSGMLLGLYDRKVILSFYISSDVNEDSYASLEETILQAMIDHTFS